MEDNTDGLPLGGPAVDLNKVVALNHRRSVTFINKFLINTSNFLNNFSAVAEEHLAKQSVEMQKLEIAVNILEAKLASIPGLDDIAATKQKEPSESTKPLEENPPSEQQQTAPVPEVEEVATPAAPVENVVTVKDDPRYAKYLKMLNVGVPKVAFEGKMKMENLDPALLDTPNAPVPDAAPRMMDSDESDDESKSLSSGDDFSD